MTRFVAPVLVSLALFAGPAAAQAPSAAPSGEARPEELGQVPAPPEAPGAVDPNAPLPPGHPPLDQAGSRGGMPDLPQDRVMPAPDLPAGSVRVRVVDPDGAAMPNVQVRLGIQRQSVEQGDQKDLKLVVADQEGKARFDGLSAGSRYNYRANVEHEGAAYATESFSLREDMGMEVTLHVFPATSDIRRAMIATQAIAVISPRDDVFQFEVLYRVFNASKITWVPRDLVIDMPTGFKAFTAEEGMSDTRAIAEGSSVRLAGTFSPGQHEITFRFQVPNEHDPEATFRMGLPPHTGEVRIIAEAARGMTMNVEGAGASETTTGEDGRPLLVSGRRIKNGEGQMPDVTVRLSGIPTPPPGRWYAIVLAGLFVAGGLSTALGDKKQKAPEQSAVNPQDALRAKELLLEELAALESAYRTKEVGPRTYEAARRALVDALARLESQLPKPTKKRGATSRPARGMAS